MNDTPTPRTNALLGKILYDCGVLDEDNAPEEWVQLARQLERERDEALTALMEIEEIFVDGSDTYEDWKSMGTIARKFLSENDQEEARRQ
jgi:hypothetical protein